MPTTSEVKTNPTAIVPMNYRLGADHQLFTKTAPGSALAQLAAMDAEVVFEVDYHADDSGSLGAY